MLLAFEASPKVRRGTHPFKPGVFASHEPHGARFRRELRVRRIRRGSVRASSRGMRRRTRGRHGSRERATPVFPRAHRFSYPRGVPHAIPARLSSRDGHARAFPGWFQESALVTISCRYPCAFPRGDRDARLGWEISTGFRRRSAYPLTGARRGPTPRAEFEPFRPRPRRVLTVPFPVPSAFLALHAVAPGDCLFWSEHSLHSE